MKKSNILIYAIAILAGVLVYRWISNIGSDLEVKIDVLERESDSLKSELSLIKSNKPKFKHQKDFKPAGSDFYYGNISIRDDKEVLDFDGGGVLGPGIKVLGEILNKSQIRYEATSFILTIFNSESKILAVREFYISNFFPQQTKSFKVTIKEITSYQVDRIKLQLEMEDH